MAVIVLVIYSPTQSHLYITEEQMHVTESNWCFLTDNRMIPHLEVLWRLLYISFASSMNRVCKSAP